jgi:hypothetical protein
MKPWAYISWAARKRVAKHPITTAISDIYRTFN